MLTKLQLSHLLANLLCCSDDVEAGVVKVSVAPEGSTLWVFPEDLVFHPRNRISGSFEALEFDPGQSLTPTTFRVCDYGDPFALRLNSFWLATIRIAESLGGSSRSHAVFPSSPSRSRDTVF